MSIENGPNGQERQEAEELGKKPTTSGFGRAVRKLAMGAGLLASGYAIKLGLENRPQNIEGTKVAGEKNKGDRQAYEIVTNDQTEFFKNFHKQKDQFKKTDANEVFSRQYLEQNIKDSELSRLLVEAVEADKKAFIAWKAYMDLPANKEGNSFNDARAAEDALNAKLKNLVNYFTKNFKTQNKKWSSNGNGIGLHNIAQAIKEHIGARDQTTRGMNKPIPNDFPPKDMFEE